MSCNHLYDCPRCENILYNVEMERDAAITALREAISFVQAECQPSQQTIQKWIWACNDGVSKDGKAVTL